ncbi:hypothetical protein [Streptomyces sp. NPDC005799]|uniref:hypothetical protein n=1 Tax=Streptomyces sp. NPDC005799 TaxID=3154678 RepID=UPI0033EA8647
MRSPTTCTGASVPAVMVTQFLSPTDRALRPWDTVLIAVNALFVGAATTADLPFGKAEFEPFANR